MCKKENPPKERAAVAALKEGSHVSVRAGGWSTIGREGNHELQLPSEARSDNCSENKKMEEKTVVDGRECDLEKGAKRCKKE